MRRPSRRYKTTVASVPGRLDLAAIVDEALIADLQAREKHDALREMVALAARSPHVQDRDKLEAAILSREYELSTGIGAGVAMPHAKLDSVTDKVVAVGRLRDGIEFDALDGKPVHIIVMIAIPEAQSREGLNLLSRLVTRLKETSVRKGILSALDARSIKSALIGEPA